MATWTQPAAFERQKDTNILITETEQSFTAVFHALGRVEIGNANVRRFYPTDGGAAIDLPQLTDTAVLRSPTGNGSTATYTDFYVKALNVVSTDNAFVEVNITLSKKTTSVTFTRPAVTTELLWVASQEAIENFPAWQTDLDATESTNLKMKDILAAWFMESDPAKKAALFARMNTTTKLVAGKKALGIQSYYTFHPVVRRTVRSTSEPSMAGAGGRDTPPITAPGTWTYLKTGANKTFTGESATWETSEEWTGSATLDPDLYP